MTTQGFCAMSKAGICDLNACLHKCFGGSNLHNTAARPPGSLSQSFLCFSKEIERINHMETKGNNRHADMPSPQTFRD